MPMSPRLLRPRASGGFSPKSIGGLTGWWDSQDTATITLNATTVSEWRDKSGNDYHMSQATAANQPTYAASVFGAKSAVRFAQSAAQNLSTNAIYLDAIGDDTNRRITILGVCRFVTGTNNSQKTPTALGTSTGLGFFHNLSNIAYWDAGPESTARVSGSLNTSVVQAGCIFVGRRDGGAVDQWYNGTLLAGSRTNATGNLRTGNHPFGIQASGSAVLAYGEVIAYNRALTTAERQTIEKYLGSKYGLTVA